MEYEKKFCIISFILEGNNIYAVLEKQTEKINYCFFGDIEKFGNDANKKKQTFSF